MSDIKSEIEIEHIDLDMDKYDVTIDVNSTLESIQIPSEDLLVDKEPEKLSTDLKEETLGIDLDTGFTETTPQEEIGKETNNTELFSGENEDNISLSGEELDSIVGNFDISDIEVPEEEGIKLSEEVEEPSEINISLEGVTSADAEIVEYTEISQEPGIEEEKFTTAEESFSIESEILSEPKSKDYGLESVDFSSPDESLVTEKELFSEPKLQVSEGKVEGIGIEGFELASEEAYTQEKTSEEISYGKVEDLGDILIMSDKDYNKIIEESSEISNVEEVKIVEKPIEEEEPISQLETEELPGTPIEPSEVLGEGIEVKDFEEISYQSPEEEQLAFEVSPTDLESIVSSEGETVSATSLEEEMIEGIVEKDVTSSIVTDVELEELSVSEIELPEVTETTKEEKSKVEFVDDFKIENEYVEEIVLTEEKYSLTPEELGLEEISVEEPKTPPELEDIVGIGFQEEPRIQVEELSKQIVEPEIQEEIVENIEETQTQQKTQEMFEEAIESLGEQDKEDIRKILKYLDKLLENLPEDKIKEFASSEYYDLYVKLFDKLNIK